LRVSGNDIAFVVDGRAFTSSKPVLNGYTVFGCAVVATIEHASLHEAMSHDLLTCRRQCMNRTFEAVERMGLTIHRDLKGLVISLPQVSHVGI